MVTVQIIMSLLIITMLVKERGNYLPRVHQRVEPWVGDQYPSDQSLYTYYIYTYCERTLS